MDSGEGSVWKWKITTDHHMEHAGVTHCCSSNCKKIIQKNNKKHRKKTSKSQNNNYNLLRFEELPEYMKDNEYILNHYRANWPLKQALLSIFRWHNETLNVWT